MVEVKIGALVSFRGSGSLGVITGFARDPDDVWIVPVCGTNKWMQPHLGDGWVVSLHDLEELDDEYKALSELLYE